MSSLGFAQLERLWEQAGGAPANAQTAAAVALTESHGSLTAIDNTAEPSLPGYHQPGPGDSPEYSVGPWQINEIAHGGYSAASTARLETATGNAQAAVAVATGRSGAESFDPWSTFTSGAYLANLPGGVASSGPGLQAPAATTPAPTASSSSGGGLATTLNEAGRRVLEVLAGLFLIYLALRQLGSSLGSMSR